MKNTAALADNSLSQLRHIANVATSRQADHESTCTICSPVAGQLTYESLLARCPQGRVLFVNANRADNVYLRILELQLAQQSVPVVPLVAPVVPADVKPRNRRTHGEP